MATSQERAQVKRPPLDPWNTRELLWLVSAVSRGGDQNWVSVARALRPLASEGARPADWFDQRSCAAQYGTLLERAEAPRRKKRPSDCGSGSSGSGSASTPPPPSSDTPQQTLLKRLTQDRVSELKKQLVEDAHCFAKLTAEIKELVSGEASDARVRALAAAFENEQRQKQREAAKHAQWLREREERKSERGWRRSDSDAPHSSPLLTSLLQNSTAPNQAAPADSPTPPPSVSTPTSDRALPELPAGAEELRPAVDKVPYHELQKIEQIKSELQKIEQNLIAGSGADPDSMLNVLPLHSVSNPELSTVKDPPLMKWPSKTEPMKTPEKIEIDDIEIKAEDVYAFSDIDLDIPPVSSIHKTPIGRSVSDKNLFNKKELSSNAIGADDGQSSTEQDNVEDLQISISPDNVPIAPEAEVPVTNTDSSKSTVDTKKSSENISQAEIKNIENKNSEESSKANDNNAVESVDSIEVKLEKLESSSVENPEDDESDSEMNQSVSTLKKDTDSKKNQDNKISENIETISPELKDPITNDGSSSHEKKDASVNENSTSKTSEQQIDSNTEIYDDAPMEVIREDKPGKTKRDYSRKKTDKEERHSPIRELENVTIKSEYNEDIGSDNSQESSDKKMINRKFKNDLGGSRSESPATPTDSLPNSPAPATPPSNTSHNTSQSLSEQDKDYRIWKKSVNLALNRLFALKNASLFLRPITDDHAPGYSLAIKKPMDLSTIRRNIDLGVIKTTQEFQRDVLLMLTNALMYNRTDHRVYAMTLETIQAAVSEINLLLQAQAHAAAQTPTLSRLTRPPRPASRAAGPPVKRKRGGNDTPTNKKRRVDEN